MAAFHGFEEIVKIFIEHGANVNIQNKVFFFLMFCFVIFFFIVDFFICELLKRVNSFFFDLFFFFC